jgi:hypothetical protein
MDWMWPVFKEYVQKLLQREGFSDPTDEQLEAKFFESISTCSVTILVQEPWQNSVRFKTLARLEAADATALYANPMTWLFDHYGGGKFKLNFHKGWHFVATQNFKPEGDPRWKEMPELRIEY